MHDNNIHYPRRIGSRVSFSAQKTKVKQCVVLRQQQVLVLWLVGLVMAFRNVQNLLLINHNNGFIDDDDEFVALYDLYASKNLNFPYNSYVPFDLKRLMSLRVLQSFAVENEIYEFWRSFANPWHNYLQSALCLWWTRRSLHAAKVAFIPMQIWRHDP